MWASIGPTYLPAFGHHLHGSGWSHLWSTVAHAALWSVVGRLIWHAPWVLLLLVVPVAGWYLVARSGGRTFRGAARGRGLPRRPGGHGRSSRGSSSRWSS
jgi:hypothetical protein